MLPSLSMDANRTINVSAIVLAPPPPPQLSQSSDERTISARGDEAAEHIETAASTEPSRTGSVPQEQGRDKQQLFTRRTRQGAKQTENTGKPAAESKIVTGKEGIRRPSEEDSSHASQPKLSNIRNRRDAEEPSYEAHALAPEVQESMPEKASIPLAEDTSLSTVTASEDSATVTASEQQHKIPVPASDDKAEAVPSETQPPQSKRKASAKESSRQHKRSSSSAKTGPETRKRRLGLESDHGAPTSSAVVAALARHRNNPAKSVVAAAVSEDSPFSSEPSSVWSEVDGGGMDVPVVLHPHTTELAAQMIPGELYSSDACF